jgi:hypothetical protein
VFGVGSERSGFVQCADVRFQGGSLKRRPTLQQWKPRSQE